MKTFHASCHLTAHTDCFHKKTCSFLSVYLEATTFKMTQHRYKRKKSLNLLILQYLSIMKLEFIFSQIVYLCCFQQVQLINHNFTEYSLFCPEDEDNSASICYSFSTHSRCTSIPNDALRCRDSNVVALDSKCIIYDEHHDKVFIGSCLYDEVEKRDLKEFVYRRISQKIKKLKCKKSLSRSGILCGQCEDNYFPLGYSYNLTCVHCPNRYLNLLLFFLEVFIPLTLFGLIIIGLKVNILNSHLHGFIFYSQAITAPPFARVVLNGPFIQQSHYSTVIKLIASYYSLWNLDIFRPLSPGICLPLRAHQILWLEVAIGIYPLLMIIILYATIRNNNCAIVAHIYNRFSKIFSIQPSKTSSLIGAFATFIVLASIKILTSSLDLLASTPVYELSQKNYTPLHYRVFYDPTLRYFRETYKNIFFPAISIVLLFIAFPFLILVVYPCKLFHKCLNRTPLNWNTLHIFMDTFQGSYKNGTKPNSHDYRWFSALFFGGRMILCFIYVSTYNSMYFIFASMEIVVIVLLVVVLKPFRTSVRRYSYSTTMFLMLLSLFYVTLVGLDIASFKNTTYMVEIFYAASVISTLIPIIHLLLVIAGKIMNCFKSNLHDVLLFHVVKQCLK